MRRKINVYLLYRAIWGAGELNDVINIYLNQQHQNSKLSFCKGGGGGWGGGGGGGVVVVVVVVNS